MLGSTWDHVGLEAETKMMVSVVTGKRTAENTQRLVEDFAERTNHEIPRLITTDEYAPYKEAIVSTYGEVNEMLVRTGPGRPPEAEKTVPSNLVYATVHKTREKGRVVNVRLERIFGVEEDLEAALQLSSVSKKVNTTFVERCHATSRHLNSRKARKVYSFSKDPGIHENFGYFIATVYNWVRPHRGLRVGPGDSPHAFLTPAVAAELTDHQWSFEELVTTAIPGPHWRATI